jgi:hypothetical protein
MKTQRMSFAASLTYKPANPERTARRSVTCGGMGWDIEFKTWPARDPMARSIRMQQKRETRPDDWRACVPLSDGEGY